MMQTTVSPGGFLAADVDFRSPLCRKVTPRHAERVDFLRGGYLIIEVTATDILNNLVGVLDGSGQSRQPIRP